MAESVTLYHPTLADVSVTVEGNAKAWLAQGWQKTPPTGAKVQPAEEDAE
jgi:hypothetical protein